MIICIFATSSGLLGSGHLVKYFDSVYSIDVHVNNLNVNSLHYITEQVGRTFSVWTGLTRHYGREVS